MAKKHNFTESAKNPNSAGLPWENFDLFMRTAVDLPNSKFLPQGFPGSVSMFGNPPPVPTNGAFILVINLLPGAAARLPVFHKFRNELFNAHTKMIRQAFPDLDPDRMNMDEFAELMENLANKIDVNELPKLVCLMKKLDAEEVNNIKKIAVVSLAHYKNQDFGERNDIAIYTPAPDSPEDAIEKFLAKLFENILSDSWEDRDSIALEDQIFRIIITYLKDVVPHLKEDHKFPGLQTAAIHIPTPHLLDVGHPMRHTVAKITGTFTEPQNVHAIFALAVRHGEQGVDIELRGPYSVDPADPKSIIRFTEAEYGLADEPVFSSRIKPEKYLMAGSGNCLEQSIKKLDCKCKHIAGQMLEVMGLD